MNQQNYDNPQTLAPTNNNDSTVYFHAQSGFKTMQWGFLRNEYFEVLRK